MRNDLIARQWLDRQVADAGDDLLDPGDCRCCGHPAGVDHEPTDPCGIIAGLLAALSAQGETAPAPVDLRRVHVSDSIGLSGHIIVGPPVAVASPLPPGEIAARIPVMAAGLLTALKQECESQHARAERAEADAATLRAERDEALELLSGGKVYTVAGPDDATWPEVPTTLVERARNVVTSLAAEAIERRDAHQDAANLRETLQIARDAINPPDRDGISLHDWNRRLKSATSMIDAALTSGGQG